MIPAIITISIVAAIALFVVIIVMDLNYLPRELDRTPFAKEFLEQMPKIYIVGCWAKYGVREFYFAGKYKKDTNNPDCKKYVPLVYMYDDCNGICDKYFLRPITGTTTGSIIMWTFDKGVAEHIADAMNAFEFKKPARSTSSSNIGEKNRRKR